MQSKKYNGWTNYETWAVSLWIDNEESSYTHWREEAASELRDAGPSAYAKFTGREIFTPEEVAVLALEKALKSEFEEKAPDLGASVWSDLLGAAMSEVNWHEIAEHLIDAAKESA